ncbi:undecaprenyl-diphosphatase [Arthrobacter subterraneus]|uniref:Undecaprenyl-diphosphatase n=2 Tax=Arthrobacter TaxID=1663 RepID=A0A1G8PC12_9MICC|nr:undecaprenyl-diphosphatase [Arthrobacter subterraneus]
MSDEMSKNPGPDGAPPDGEIHDDRFVGGQDLTEWGTPPGRLLARWAHRISGLLGPHAALILTHVLGALIAVLLTVASTEIYEAVTEGDGVAALDHPILDAAQTLRSPWLDTVVTAYTNLGGPIGMPILALTTLGILTVRRRSWTPGILIVTAAAGSLLMTIAGKQSIGRSRPALTEAVPPYEYSASFPSGHSLNAVVIAGVVAYLLILRQTTRQSRILTTTAAALFAVTMGLSRVFLGHHWFTDVLVAWTLGVAWLALVITAHRLYLTARHRDTVNPSGSTEDTAGPAPSDPERP